MNLYDLIEFHQVLSIGLALEPTTESIFRIKQREYSDRFNTPLHEVAKLDMAFILQHLYEDLYPPSIVEEELEELLDKLYKIKDPTYSRVSVQETEDLVDAVLNREIARAAKKKVPTQESSKEVDMPGTPTPKSGGLNFGQLESLESKAESNKAGF